MGKKHPYTLEYTADGKTIERFEFFAECRALALDHAATLCRDHKWTQLSVRRT